MAGNELASLSSGAFKEEHVLSFSPADSGAYSFSVAASREEEEDHLGQDYGPVDFVFPLEAPYITICANNGGGAVALEWDPVHEAEGYEVAVKDSDMAPLTVTDCAAELTGLTVGETYTITVAALRGDEKSAAAEVTITVTAEAEARWSYAAFGTGVDTKNNGSEGNANEGSVRVWNTGGKGKLVPASTDGLAFYYTAIDPKTQNFKLTATASVNSWTYSNGQEGFGLMAADAVGKHGDSTTFWNNSYMAVITKVEYTAEAGKYSMKLGVGSQEKVGVTPENINEAHQLDDMSVYSSTMRTLETSCADAGMAPGTYNLVGKYTNNPGPDGTIAEPRTEFLLTLEKNNTGYFLSYTDPAGVTHTEKYYDTEALNHLDAEAGARLDEYEERPFEDVAEGRFYYQPVRWALEQGITKGVDETHFAPSQDCTRAQVVTFLWRAMEKPAATITQVPFTDVKKGSFYYKAMLWAVENKITTGTGDASFAPNDPCTRGQVVTFLWRAAGKPQPKSTEHRFTDVKKGAFYYKAMLWALEQGITTGTTETTFEPAKTCTRGEIVTFLYRALGQGE